jgi:hypothetical protein
MKRTSSECVENDLNDVQSEIGIKKRLKENHSSAGLLFQLVLSYLGHNPSPWINHHLVNAAMLTICDHYVYSEAEMNAQLAGECLLEFKTTFGLDQRFWDLVQQPDLTAVVAGSTVYAVACQGCFWDNADLDLFISLPSNEFDALYNVCSDMIKTNQTNLTDSYIYIQPTGLKECPEVLCVLPVPLRRLMMYCIANFEEDDFRPMVVHGTQKENSEYNLGTNERKLIIQYYSRQQLHKKYQICFLSNSCGQNDEKEEKNARQALVDRLSLQFDTPNTAIGFDGTQIYVPKHVPLADLVNRVCRVRFFANFSLQAINNVWIQVFEWHKSKQNDQEITNSYMTKRRKGCVLTLNTARRICKYLNRGLIFPDFLDFLTFSGFQSPSLY